MPRQYEILAEGEPFLPSDDHETKRASATDPSTVFSGTLAELVGSKRLLILEGEAGIGKTTDCRHLCEEEFLRGGIALYIKAPRLADFMGAEAIGLEETLRRLLSARDLVFAPNEIREFLHRPNSLLVVDGLDEIYDGKARLALLGHVLDYGAVNEKVRIVISSRPLNWIYRPQLRRFTIARLAPLTKTDGEKLLAKWANALARKGISREESARALSASLATRKEGELIGKSPLLLTLALFLHSGQGSAGDEVQLWGSVVGELLLSWESTKSVPLPVPPKDLLRVLSEVAIGFLEARRRDIGEVEFRSLTERSIGSAFREPPASQAEFLDLLVSRLAIFKRNESGKLEFSNDGLRDYLAALRLHDTARVSGDYLDIVRRAEDEVWRGAVILALHMLERSDAPLLKRCFASLLEKDADPVTGPLATKLLLALELLEHDFEVGLELREDLRLELRRVWETCKIAFVIKRATASLARLSGTRYHRLTEEFLWGYVRRSGALRARSLMLLPQVSSNKERVERELRGGLALRQRWIRRAALIGLASSTGANPLELQMLVDHLDDRDRFISSVSKMALARFLSRNPSMVSAVLSVFPTSSVRSQHSMIHALGFVQSEIHAIRPFLESQLESGLRSHRAASLAALRRLGIQSEKACDRAMAMLSGSDRQEAKLGSTFLLAFPAWARLHIAELRDIADRAHPSVAVFAAEVIANVESDYHAICSLLKPFTAVGIPEVQMKAAITLAKSAKSVPEAFDVLAGLTADSNPRIRGTAMLALGIGRYGEDAVRPILSGFDSPEPKIRSFAARAAGILRSESPQITEGLQRLEGDSNERVREYSFEAIVMLPIEGGLLVEALSKVFADRSKRARLRAILLRISVLGSHDIPS